ncbi:MAG: MFS transporter [Endozoicomonas sp. (ex Botrylloides leachii)]|nr:MFS transporter [Endozoicomonas sp. (ex Botrylloides leachii)]
MSSKKYFILLALGIAFISLNLRGPITSVGSVLGFISNDLHLSPTEAGMITTLPLIMFTVLSPIVPYFTKKFGLEVLIMFAITLLTVGIIIRSFGLVFTLFLGTLLIGIAIAICNVLLPALVKRDLPQHLTTITAVYTLFMAIGSTISSSFAVPILEFGRTLSLEALPNWAFSLLTSASLSVIAMVLWLPQMKAHQKKHVQDASTEQTSHRYLWRTVSAWHITLYLGCNSLIMYSLVSWLPAIAVDRGFSEHEAGIILGLNQLGTALPAFLLIPIMFRLKDMRLVSASMPFFSMCGLFGVLLEPQYAKVWAILLGVGSGGGFIVALSLIGLRTYDSAQTAALSGKSQCIGYLIAACGPVILGFIHEKTAGWSMPLDFCISICAVWAIMSMLAARKEKIMPPIKKRTPYYC